MASPPSDTHPLVNMRTLKRGQVGGIPGMWVFVPDPALIGQGYAPIATPTQPGPLPTPLVPTPATFGLPPPLPPIIEHQPLQGQPLPLFNPSIPTDRFLSQPPAPPIQGHPAAPPHIPQLRLPPAMPHPPAYGPPHRQTWVPQDDARGEDPWPTVIPVGLEDPPDNTAFYQSRFPWLQHPELVTETKQFVKHNGHGGNQIWISFAKAIVYGGQNDPGRHKSKHLALFLFIHSEYPTHLLDWCTGVQLPCNTQFEFDQEIHRDAFRVNRKKLRKDYGE